MGGNAPPKKRVYNVNVGILGHVDSGKTSLGRLKRWRVNTLYIEDLHPCSNIACRTQLQHCRPLCLQRRWTSIRRAKREASR